MASRSAALLASASLVLGDSWCPSGQTYDFPTEVFSGVTGLADNGCCHYYVAQEPATVIDIDQEEGMVVAKKNTQIVPQNVSDALGPDVVVGDLDYLYRHIFAPVHNGTHGSIVTLNYNLEAGSASEVVDEPLAWVVADYNTEWAYAGAADADRVFVFDAKNLPVVTFLRVERLQAPLKNIRGAALKGYNGMYLVSEAGEMYEVDLTTLAVTPEGNTPFGAPVRGFANLWNNGDGLLHVATTSQIQHYDTCAMAV